MPRIFRHAAAAALLALAPSPSPLFAADAAQDARITQLEQQVQALTEELARLRTRIAVPEEPELKSAYGLGPAASKVYGGARGLSLGGYGEAQYTRFTGDADGEDDRADALRTVLYLGYKFSDKLLFNSEIEFEHGSTSDVKNGAGSGSVSVEFAAVDWLLRPQLNLRAGLLLAPMGFINEVHEPPFFYGVARPEVERRIVPSTWRNPGVGVFGELGESFSYRAYVMSGLNGERIRNNGIRDARQKGNRTLANDGALVLRGDFQPARAPGLLLGGSLYVGEVDQDLVVEETDMRLPDARMWLGEAHLQYRRGPWSLRALFAYTKIENAGDLTSTLGLDDTPCAVPPDPDEICGDNMFVINNSIAEVLLGGYAELAYDIGPRLFHDDAQLLAPFVRVEYVDTQYAVASAFERNRANAYWVRTAGLQYHPHPNVAFKLEYRNLAPRAGEMPDALALGVGFAF